MNDAIENESIRAEMIALLPRLRRFARTIARNVHDADDLVQITIERALARLAQYRPHSGLASWMFGIMKNAWIDEVRARTRQARLFAPEEAGANVGDGTEDAPLNALSLQEAMARLPEDQRMSVGLVLVEGLSYKEAAEVMGVPMGTLTSRLARGREALERMLADPAGAAP